MLELWYEASITSSTSAVLAYPLETISHFKTVDNVVGSKTIFASATEPNSNVNTLSVAEYVTVAVVNSSFVNACTASCNAVATSAKLVAEYQNNPDKNIKKASLEALYIMYKPEFKKDLMPIFEQATTSQTPEISLLAKDILNVINK